MVNCHNMHTSDVYCTYSRNIQYIHIDTIFDKYIINMNAVVSLNHFCEIHGPQVLFCTQTFHDTMPFQSSHMNERNSPISQKRFYGNPEIIQDTKINCPDCEACRSIDKNILGLISSDHKNRTSFVSSQHPLTSGVSHITKQACLRSLSCELSKESASKGDQPVFFGDSIRGQVLSLAFNIHDAQARGFHRLFSICVVMRDALFLLQAWPFLTSQLRNIISQLQENATKVYAKEQAQCPQRALRLNAGAAMATTTVQKQVNSPAISVQATVFPQELPVTTTKHANKVARSLIELTAEPFIYHQLHRWFVWLLKAGAERLEENLTPPTFLHDASITWGTETEDGFVLVPSPVAVKNASNSEQGVKELEASGSSEASSILAGPQLQGGVSELYRYLNRSQFLAVVHCLLVGHQLVVKCEWPSLAAGIIQALKPLVTRAIYRPRLWSTNYESPGVCSLLAIPTTVAMPLPTPSNVLCLDIIRGKGDSSKDKNLIVLGEKVEFIVRPGGSKPPARWPTLLLKMDKALQNSFLTPTALHCHLVALKEEWLNISRTVMRLHQTGTSSADLSALMTTLGAQSYDWQLISYWGTLDYSSSCKLE